LVSEQKFNDENTAYELIKPSYYYAITIKLKNSITLTVEMFAVG